MALLTTHQAALPRHRSRQRRARKGPAGALTPTVNLTLAVTPCSLTTYYHQVPAWVSAGLGVVLWVPQAVHLLFAGLISLALRLLASPIVGLSL